jgi:hypothetical protein
LDCADAEPGPGKGRTGRLPREDCKVGDEYCCALREQAPKKNNEDLPKPDKTIAWGQILSYARPCGAFP